MSETATTRNVAGGSIYQRGRTYWIYYGFRGKRYRESSKSTKLKDAKDLLRRRLAEMGKGRLVGPREEKLSFENLAKMIQDDYKVNGRASVRRLKLSLQHLRGFFGLSPALSITTDRIRSYIVQRQEDGAAPATIKQELAHLKRAFNLALQAERLTSRPYIPSVAVNNTREGFLEAGDLERLLRHLPAHLRPVVRFAYLTGWRKSEILPLQWSQVDWTAGVVRLAPGTTKNKEGREFPFKALPALGKLLDEQRAARALERGTGKIIPNVFHHRGGQPIRDIAGAWQSACKAAGLDGLLFHDMRRSAVRNMERAGVSRSVAMKLSGHKPCPCSTATRSRIR